MAVHAGKLHGSVDGVFELFRVDEERHRLAVHIGSEGGVAVATEAIFVFQLVLGASGESRAQQKERKRTEQDSAGNFHAMRRRFCELVCRDRSHRTIRNGTQRGTEGRRTIERGRAASGRLQKGQLQVSPLAALGRNNSFIRPLLPINGSRRSG